MAKKKRKEVDRIPMGILIMGGTVSPVCAYQTYRITYDDGTEVIDRGRTLHTMPGMLLAGSKPPKDVRPDLSPHMQAAQILLERIGNACWDLDTKGKK